MKSRFESYKIVKSLNGTYLVVDNTTRRIPCVTRAQAELLASILKEFNPNSISSKKTDSHSWFINTPKGEIMVNNTTGNVLINGIKVN